MSSEIHPRVFTREEADALLPALTEGWHDLCALHAAEGDARAALARLRARILEQGDPPEAALELAAHLEEVAARRVACYQKQQMLEADGPLLRELETGTFDFPAIRAGQPIYLCWRVGETHVSHWHEVLGSFDARQDL